MAISPLPFLVGLLWRIVTRQPSGASIKSATSNATRSVIRRYAACVRATRSGRPPERL
jgi:hypothetical protein